VKKTILSLIACFLLALAPAQALENGLARTPPMGWNSWNKFGCDVSEKLVKGMADAMVTSEMKDAGYQYVVIDDCWQVSRDGEGNIVPDPQRFPSGMKALADYVHSQGPEVWNLLRRGHSDVPGPSRESRLRISGRPSIRRLECGLPQIRLVQSREAGGEVLLFDHARRLEGFGPPHPLQPMRVG